MRSLAGALQCETRLLGCSMQQHLHLAAFQRVLHVARCKRQATLQVRQQQVTKRVVLLVEGECRPVVVVLGVRLNLHALCVQP